MVVAWKAARDYTPRKRNAAKPRREELMKRIWWITCAIALGVATGASAKDKITCSHLIDPTIEAFLWPIKTGKIKSDLIEIEFTPQSIPAAIQATATKQFDVITTAGIAIPKAIDRGLDLRILSVSTVYPKGSRGGDVWVRADSPYKTIADLKGKTIAVSSFDSTGTTWIRLGLWKKYNVNVRYENGDFQWVQIPAGAQPGALASGKVEASTLIHTQALQALNSKMFRSIASTATDNFELYGVPSVAGVNVSYPEKLAARPAQFREFNRMIKASHDYTMSHIDEVSAAIAQQAKVPPNFIKEWTEKIGDSPGTFTETDKKSLEVLWKVAKELGILKDYPDVNKVVWEGAITK
jgi:NitT/TauT family transport system substrate-binding protein